MDIDRFKEPRNDSSSVPRNAPFVVVKLPSDGESTRSRPFQILLKRKIRVLLIGKLVAISGKPKLMVSTLLSVTSTQLLQLGTWRESTMSTAMRREVGAVGRLVHLCRQASSAAHASLLGAGLRALNTCTHCMPRMPDYSSPKLWTSLQEADKPCTLPSPADS